MRVDVVDLRLDVDVDLCIAYLFGFFEGASHDSE